jgi:hypothetical protein
MVIWPRLVVLLGKYKRTVLCGIMFGIIHTPVNIVIKGSDPFQAILSSLGLMNPSAAALGFIDVGYDGWI